MGLVSYSLWRVFGRLSCSSIIIFENRIAETFFPRSLSAAEALFVKRISWKELAAVVTGAKSQILKNSRQNWTNMSHTFES